MSNAFLIRKLYLLRQCLFSAVDCFFKIISHKPDAPRVNLPSGQKTFNAVCPELKRKKEKKNAVFSVPLVLDKNVNMTYFFLKLLRQRRYYAVYNHDKFGNFCFSRLLNIMELKMKLFPRQFGVQFRFFCSLK